MDDASKEDERFNASKVRGSGYLDKARSSGSGEHAAGLGRWENDRGRGTYRSKRRDEVRHGEIPGALRTGATIVETRRERAGCSGPLVRSPQRI